MMPSKRILVPVVAMLAVWATVAVPAFGWPRVAGTWRVTFTPMNYNDQPQSVTWRLRPFCRTGACSWLASSSTGGRFVYRFDNSLTRYTWTRDAGPSPNSNCVSKSSGAVIVRHGYFNRSHTSLRVMAQRAGRARRMKGLAYDDYTPTGEARAKGCPSRTLIDRVYAVRLR